MLLPLFRHIVNDIRINKCLACAVTFMIFLSALPLHGTEVTQSGVRYEVNGSSAKVLGPTSKNVSTITIESTIQRNIKVDEIADEAFKDCQDLITVTIYGSSYYKCGKRAFFNCKKLKKVTISCGRTTLGESAFEGCSELETVEGMSNIVLGRSCFRNCSKLELPYKDYWPFYQVSESSIYRNNITVPARALENCKRITGLKLPLSYYNTITEIGEYAFAGTGIEKLELPESITYIGEGAFARCENLSRFEIPEKIKVNLNYSKGVFEGCSSLQYISIPSTWTVIPAKMFKGCTSLNYNPYHDNVVTKISDNAFDGCTSLTDFTLKESISQLGDSIFARCSGLTSITIPESVSKITKGMFKECTSLKEVVMKNNITEIDDEAFKGCTSLEFRRLNHSITKIGKDAFSGCLSLTSIQLPNFLENLGYGAFSYCDNLEAVSIGRVNDKFTSADGVLYNKDKTSVWIWPGAKKEVVIQEGVTNIEDKSFQGNKQIVKVTLPESIKSIGAYAFADCPALEQVDFPSSLNRIGEYAFYNCSSLKEVSLPVNIWSIDRFAFSGCGRITSVNIPASLYNIEEGVFANCSNLKAIEVASENPSYASNDGLLFNKYFSWLHQCPGGKDKVSLPESTITISSYAFDGCKLIEEVKLPNKVKNIRTMAFRNCKNLYSITIPSSVTSIEAKTFVGCPIIEEVYCCWQTPIGTYTDIFDTQVYENAILYYPEGYLSGYQSKDCWKNFLLMHPFEYSDFSGVEFIDAPERDKKIIGIYDIQGHSIPSDYKGIRIINYSDGTVRKLLSK